MKILKMTEENLDKYVAIYDDVFSREPWNIKESKDDIMAYFQKYFDMNNFLGYELRHKEELIGFSMGYKKPWIEGFEYFIDQYCIKYDKQKKGFGKMFLEGLDEYLFEEEVVNITLMTDKYLGAFKFYRENGFESLNEYRILTKEI